MSKQTDPLQISYKDVIRQAIDAIGVTAETISHNVRVFPHTITKDYEDGEESQCIKVRFNWVRTTMTCIFLGDETCTSVLLQVDKLEEIVHYIESLVADRKFDADSKTWILPNCKGKILIEEHTIFILFYV